MADVLFQNLPSQSVVLPSHEILLDNGSVTGRATISKVIELFNNSGSINKLTSSGSIDIKSNTDLSGGDINFYNGNTLISKLIDSENQIVYVCDYYFDETIIYTDSALLTNKLIELGITNEELEQLNNIEQSNNIEEQNVI